jgi:hypothetical protein
VGPSHRPKPLAPRANGVGRSGLSDGLLRLLLEAGGGFLTKRFLAAGRLLGYLAQSFWASAVLVIVFSNTVVFCKAKFGEVLYLFLICRL